MTLITPITIPRAIFAAAAAARPSTAPQPAATAVPVCADTVYSNTAAPANDPTNAPITDPITGAGTPITAPTNPPINSPRSASARCGLLSRTPDRLTLLARNPPLEGRPSKGPSPKAHCTGYVTFASTVTRRREPVRPPAIATSL